MAAHVQPVNFLSGQNDDDICSWILDLPVPSHQVYICHDVDTGRELAVKQVEIGRLNHATQKVNNIHVYTDSVLPSQLQY